MRICHPASWRGSGLFFRQTQGFRLRPAGYAETGTPWAMESVALTGSEFLGLSARQIPIFRLAKNNPLIAGAIRIEKIIND